MTWRFDGSSAPRASRRNDPEIWCVLQGVEVVNDTFAQDTIDLFVTLDTAQNTTNLFVTLNTPSIYINQGLGTIEDWFIQIQYPGKSPTFYPIPSIISCLFERVQTWISISVPDTSPSYLLFQTLLPLFWTPICMIWMELTRTDDVFNRIAMVLFLCRNRSSQIDLKNYGEYFWNI